MTDARALSWTHLIPAGANFHIIGAPAWLHDALENKQQTSGRAILVAWNLNRSEFPDLAAFSGVVAINCPDLAERTLESAGFSHARRFAVLPSLDDARWFVPLSSPTLAAAAFRLYTPYRALARVRHLGVRIAARSGLALWYHDQVCIAQRALPPIERVLQTVLDDRPIHLAISTGTPGPARKPTWAVLGADGRMLAIAKRSCSPLSRQLVQHEATVLQALAAHSGSHVAAPQLLLQAEIDDGYLTAQEALPGHPTGRLLTPQHDHFLYTLASGPAVPATSTTLLTAFPARIANLESPGSDLRPFFERIVQLLDGALLPKTIVHGDFAPWNLRRQDEQIAAFDWEFAELDGLPLLDEFHHRLQVGFLLDGWTEERAYNALREPPLHPPAYLSPKHMMGLQLAYLLDAFVRRCELGNGKDDLTRLRYGHLLHRLLVDSRLAAS